jgi:plastocyanin
VTVGRFPNAPRRRLTRGEPSGRETRSRSDIQAAEYHPGTTKRVAVIKKGGKVSWKWTQGGVSHNVTPAAGGSGSRTTSQKGFTFTKTFSKAGTFRTRR